MRLMKDFSVEPVELGEEPDGCVGSDGDFRRGPAPRSAGEVRLQLDAVMTVSQARRIEQLLHRMQLEERAGRSYPNPDVGEGVNFGGMGGGPTSRVTPEERERRERAERAADGDRDVAARRAAAYSKGWTYSTGGNQTSSDVYGDIGARFAEEARRAREARREAKARAQQAMNDFVGFTETWRQLLDLPAGTVTRAQVTAAFRSKAKAAHPDTGGSDEAMKALNQAYQTALEAAV